MLLSSLMLNHCHSKKDLFWLPTDHAHSSRQHPAFRMGDATHHGALLLQVPLSTLCSPLLPSDLPLWLVHLLPALWTLFLPILLPPCLLPTLPPTRMLFHLLWRIGRGEHVKDAGRASLFSFTCSPLPIEQTLLPLPFVPIYLPKYHSEIFLALYKSFMFYNLILHPGCKCYCCQSPRNTYK